MDQRRSLSAAILRFTRERVCLPIYLTPNVFGPRLGRVADLVESNYILAIFQDMAELFGRDVNAAYLPDSAAIGSLNLMFHNLGLDLHATADGTRLRAVGNDDDVAALTALLEALRQSRDIDTRATAEDNQQK